MSLSAHGKSTSTVEVTHVSGNGIWVLAGDRELFLPFESFPWFKEQPISSILNVQEVSAGHFHWPEMDVDLTLEIIEHPERFPHIAKTTVQGHGRQ